MYQGVDQTVQVHSGQRGGGQHKFGVDGWGEAARAGDGLAVRATAPPDRGIAAVGPGAAAGALRCLLVPEVPVAPPFPATV